MTNLKYFWQLYVGKGEKNAKKSVFAHHPPKNAPTIMKIGPKPKYPRLFPGILLHVYT
jgi:hypothetical protein